MPEKVQIKTKTIIVEAEDIELRTVNKSGNGAVIPYLKKYIGKEVYVILKENCKTK